MKNQSVAVIDIETIQPDPKQPRQFFDEAKLKELAQTIKAVGVLHPILVEETEKENEYLLVAGERRLRAMKLNGWTELVIGRDVIVRERSNHNGRERYLVAVVENVQRADMNVMEIARAFAKLKNEHGMSVDEISQKTGKQVSLIYWHFKLLTADPRIQKLWEEKKISHELNVVSAIFSLPAGEDSVRLVETLAENQATGKEIKSAIARYLKLMESGVIKAKSGKKSSKDQKGSPAERKAKEIEETLQDEWNALYSLGKVPPWPVVNDAVLATCDSCALHSVAGESLCGSCAMVTMLKKMQEAAGGSRNV